MILFFPHTAHKVVFIRFPMSRLCLVTRFPSEPFRAFILNNSLEHVELLKRLKLLTTISSFSHFFCHDSYKKEWVNSNGFMAVITTYQAVHNNFVAFIAPLLGLLKPPFSLLLAESVSLLSGRWEELSWHAFRRPELSVCFWILWKSILGSFWGYRFGINFS